VHGELTHMPTGTEAQVAAAEPLDS
jgi:hypothetical protein